MPRQSSTAPLHPASARRDSSQHDVQLILQQCLNQHVAGFFQGFDVEVGNELFYYIFEGEPQPVKGYIQLDDNNPGLGLEISEEYVSDFNIVE